VSKQQPRVWLVIYDLIPSTDQRSNTQVQKEVYLAGVRGPGCKNPGLLNFFGGRVDPGETPEQAVLRELREETGMEAQSAHMTLLFRDLLRTERIPVTWFRIDRQYVDMSHRITTSETTDYEWVDSSYEGECLHYSISHFLSWRRLVQSRGLIPGHILCLKQKGLF
jgi:8-oxo-dGTP pyrophosphatase MutT (NUDIX family)